MRGTVTTTTLRGFLAAFYGTSLTSLSVVGAIAGLAIMALPGCMIFPAELPNA